MTSYTKLGSSHPETAALTNVLAAFGVRDPRTNTAFTEALLLGIGGGLGAGYILWEFKEHRTEHHAKVLVLGFHNQWQYTMRFYQGLCDRLGVTISMPETGSAKVATENLQQVLARDKAAVAWVDGAHMPYLQMPESMKGHLGHIVAVCGKDGDDILVDDRAAVPFRVPTAEFAAARACIGSYKNRLLLVEKVEPADIVSAVQAGLQACVDHLSSNSDSFSLPAIRKWGKMMTDPRNKKGWPTVFKDRRGLYNTLRSIYEGIELAVGRGALRGLYAEFLREAVEVTGNNRLQQVAAHYDALSTLWTGMAEAALPQSVAPLHETRTLLDERQSFIMQGGDAWKSTQSMSDKLRSMSREYNLDFPLNDADVNGLFADMQAKLMAVYEGEVAALAALKNALETSGFADDQF